MVDRMILRTYVVDLLDEKERLRLGMKKKSMAACMQWLTAAEVERAGEVAGTQVAFKRSFKWSSGYWTNRIQTYGWWPRRWRCRTGRHVADRYQQRDFQALRHLR